MKLIRRESKKEPGYDCRAVCSHEKKGQHGIHNEVWLYTLVADDSAIGLYVNSGIYPPTVLGYEDEKPTGAEISFCRNWPLYEEEVKAGPQECQLIGHCFVSNYFGMAKEFFAAHGAPVFEQPESFWKAFEAHFLELHDSVLLATVADKIEQCQTCKGEGIVKVEAAKKIDHFSVAQLRTENDRLRFLLASGEGRCIYCGLPKAENGKVFCACSIGETMMATTTENPIAEQIETTIECIYCHSDVPGTEETPVPALDDDTAWRRLAEHHAATCEWVLTRAHRRD